MPVNSVNGRDGNLFLPRALPDKTLAETAISAPTITLTQQSTSTIASAQALMTPDQSRFTYTANCAFGAVFPDTTLFQPVSRYDYSWGSPPFYSVAFGTDAATFEFMFKYISSATLYRLTVDGRKVTDLMTSTGASAVGSRHVLKFAFGTSAPRNIRLDFYTLPFGGVFVGPNDSVWKVPFKNDRVVALGDSFTAGSAQNTAAGAGTWFHRWARLLGYEDIWNSSIGGTGYVADNTGASVNFGARVKADVVNVSPDRVIVWGGYNDTSLSQTLIDANARSLFAQLQSGTDAYIVAVGAATSNGTAVSTQLATAATLQKACLDYKIPFIDPITGSVFDKDGNLIAQTGAWITPQNATAYIGGDGVHPNDAGHTYIASRMADAYIRLGNP